MYIDSLDALFMIRNAQSRSISPENPTGNAGMGGMEASKLGSGRKGRPKISLEQGEVVTLADIQGPGSLRCVPRLPMVVGDDRPEAPQRQRRHAHPPL